MLRLQLSQNLFHVDELVEQSLSSHLENGVQFFDAGGQRVDRRLQGVLLERERAVECIGKRVDGLFEEFGKAGIGLQKEVGESGPLNDHPEIKAAPRDDLPSVEEFYDLLKPAATHLDIWHTVYNHVMASPAAITEWFKGSSLQPFLSPLSAADREKFLAAYTEKCVAAYKPRYDGKVLLRFPRLFILAVR